MEQLPDDTREVLTDSVPERYYAMERLKEVQDKIRGSARSMVIRRALVEKYRQSDLPMARESYEQLLRDRETLLEALSEAQLCLMEAESYNLASAASQLHTGLARFDLMSLAYKPVYEAMVGFAGRFPLNGRASAAAIASDGLDGFPV